MNRGWSSAASGSRGEKGTDRLGSDRWQRGFRVGSLRVRPFDLQFHGKAEIDAPLVDEFADDDPEQRQMRAEAVLLLAKTPLNTRKLAQLAHLADATEARTLIRRLNQIYDDFGRALRIEQVAGGFRMMTRASLAPWLSRLGHLPPLVRLSSPMMETLSVVAYRQPVSRASVEAVRGVACGELLRQLMERDLIRIAGRSEELGRPYLYGTTKRFLQLFGLPGTDALPPIQWQALQEDPPPSDSLPEDLTTPMKESVVSTAVASLVTDTESEVANPAQLHPADQQAITAVIEDEENEVYEDDEEDEFDDDDYDDDFDEEDDGDWDDEEDDDEDWDEEDDDLEEDDDWEEVEDGDEEIEDDEDEDEDYDDEEWDDDDDWDEEEEDEEEDEEDRE